MPTLPQLADLLITRSLRYIYPGPILHRIVCWIEFPVNTAKVLVLLHNQCDTSNKEEGNARFIARTKRSRCAVAGTHAQDQTGDGRRKPGADTNAVSVANRLAGSLDLFPHDRPVQQPECRAETSALRSTDRCLSGCHLQGYSGAARLPQKSWAGAIWITPPFKNKQRLDGQVNEGTYHGYGIQHSSKSIRTSVRKVI